LQRSATKESRKINQSSPSSFSVLALSAGSVAGEHIQEKLGRDDIARVVNLAPLVDLGNHGQFPTKGGPICPGHIWGVVARLVEELAGEGIFRRFCNIILSDLPKSDLPKPAKPTPLIMLPPKHLNSGGIWCEVQQTAASN
jgi:hypothetical protein